MLTKSKTRLSRRERWFGTYPFLCQAIQNDTKELQSAANSLPKIEGMAYSCGQTISLMSSKIGQQ